MDSLNIGYSQPNFNIEQTFATVSKHSSLKRLSPEKRARYERFKTVALLNPNSQKEFFIVIDRGNPGRHSAIFSDSVIFQEQKETKVVERKVSAFKPVPIRFDESVDATELIEAIVEDLVGTVQKIGEDIVVSAAEKVKELLGSGPEDVLDKFTSAGFKTVKGADASKLKLKTFEEIDFELLLLKDGKGAKTDEKSEGMHVEAEKLAPHATIAKKSSTIGLGMIAIVGKTAAPKVSSRALTERAIRRKEEETAIIKQENRKKTREVESAKADDRHSREIREGQSSDKKHKTQETDNISRQEIPTGQDQLGLVEASKKSKTRKGKNK